MDYTRIYKNMKITYEELDKALLHKKYKKKIVDQFLIYSNKKFDSLILLPLQKKKAIVNSAHFASTSYIFSQKGVIKKAQDLAKWIEKYRLNKKNIAA